MFQVHGRQGAIFLETDFDVGLAAAGPAADHFFFTRVWAVDRLLQVEACEAGYHEVVGGDIAVQRESVLSAEAGAGKGRHIVHHAGRNAECLGQTELFVVHTLRVGVHMKFGAVEVGGTTARFHGRTLAVGVLECFLVDDVVRFCEPLFDVTEAVVLCRCLGLEQARFPGRGHSCRHGMPSPDSWRHLQTPEASPL